MLRYLAQTGFSANRSAGLIFGLAVLLAGCSAERVDRDWVEARDVPNRPTQEYTLEERQAIRDDLTDRGDRERYDAEMLRYQVGLRPEPPAPLPPKPPAPPAKVVIQPPPAPPNVRAAYLKQQIEAEVQDDSLTAYFIRLPDTPIDVDAALAAGTLRPVRTDLERVTLKRFEPIELEPSYPKRAFDWLNKTDRVPPLNRLLSLVGITPQPRLVVPLQTPAGQAVDTRLGGSRADAPTQTTITSRPVPTVPTEPPVD